jgi:hypothetical protein
VRAAPLAIALCLWLVPAATSAQSSDPVAAGIEVTIGVAWSGPIALAGPDALEADRNGSPYRLFAARSDLRPGPGLVTRIGVPLGARLQVEGAIGYSAPELVVQVSSDVEGAAALRLAETLRHIQLEAGLMVSLRRPRAADRSELFVTIGAGLFRELHEGQTLAVDGRAYFAGGGLKRRLRTRSDAWLKVAGLRVEARVIARTGGAATEDRARFAPAVAASLFLRF